MLAREQVSFAIKFSTHSKHVSISFIDGQDTQHLNQAERHYRIKSNDLQLKVLPGYPSEYLKQLNIIEAMNRVETVQSDLCRSYFSQGQINSINSFLSKS